MKELKLLYLYPDMLELYGDYVHFPTIKHFPWIPRIYARRNNFRIIQENADIIKSKTKAIAIDFV